MVIPVSHTQLDINLKLWISIINIKNGGTIFSLIHDHVLVKEKIGLLRIIFEFCKSE